MNTQLTVKDLQHQAWAVKIQEQIKSGLTVSTWCSQNGMNTKTFYYPKSRVISTQNVIRDPRPVCQGKDRRAVLSL